MIRNRYNRASRYSDTSVGYKEFNEPNNTKNTRGRSRNQVNGSDRQLHGQLSNESDDSMTTRGITSSQSDEEERHDQNQSESSVSSDSRSESNSSRGERDLSDRKSRKKKVRSRRRRIVRHSDSSSSEGDGSSDGDRSPSPRGGRLERAMSFGSLATIGSKSILGLFGIGQGGSSEHSETTITSSEEEFREPQGRKRYNHSGSLDGSSGTNTGSSEDSENSEEEDYSSQATTSQSSKERVQKQRGSKASKRNSGRPENTRASESASVYSRRSYV